MDLCSFRIASSNANINRPSTQAIFGMTRFSYSKSSCLPTAIMTDTEVTCLEPRGHYHWFSLNNPLTNLVLLAFRFRIGLQPAGSAGCGCFKTLRNLCRESGHSRRTTRTVHLCIVRSSAYMCGDNPWLSITISRSTVYRTNKIGPKTDPCSTPQTR